jgi:hypothetical protein
MSGRAWAPPVSDWPGHHDAESLVTGRGGSNQYDSTTRTAAAAVLGPADRVPSRRPTVRVTRRLGVTVTGTELH